MLTMELNNDWMLSSKDYLIKDEPTSLSDQFLGFYSRMLKKYHASLSHQSYSPNDITPELAASNLKVIIKEKRAFLKLSSLYAKIQDENKEVKNIYNTLVEIVEELESAEERFNKLKNPKIHSMLLNTVNQLQYSSFLMDR
jgi:hypothetical protein